MWRREHLSRDRLFIEVLWKFCDFRDCAACKAKALNFLVNWTEQRLKPIKCWLNRMIIILRQSKSFEWFKRFMEGRESIGDYQRSGRSSTNINTLSFQFWTSEDSTNTKIRRFQGNIVIHNSWRGYIVTYLTNKLSLRHML